LASKRIADQTGTAATLTIRADRRVGIGWRLSSPPRPGRLPESVASQPIREGRFADSVDRQRFDPRTVRPHHEQPRGAEDDVATVR
jgi:hypothetical protein